MSRTVDAVGIVAADADHEHEALLPRLELGTAQHLVEEQQGRMRRRRLRHRLRDRERRHRGVLRRREDVERPERPPTASNPGKYSPSTPVRRSARPRALPLGT